MAPTSISAPAGGGCPLMIRCGTAEHESDITAEAMRELVKINASIRWYMETFLTAEPFRAPRAERVAKSLSKYAERLIESLKLAIVVPEWAASQHLVIHIREADAATGSRDSINVLRWEILQDVRRWPEKDKPATVSVVRVVDQLQPAATPTSQVDGGPPVATPTGQADDKPPAEPRAALRILALTARPQGVGDIPHRLITKDIRDVVAKANAGGDGAGPQVEFDIARPGLLEALQARLRKMGKGHYDVVHLDLHGVVKDNTLYAQFIQRAGSGAHNVAAETLAELLGSYGVRTVVLNACRSAFEDSGQAANLAKTLIQQGIDTAVAMAYNVTDVAAKLFFRVFYEQLLCHRASPFLAMQAARQCLIGNQVRKTKYRTQATVDDYLVPSLYMREPVACDAELVSKALDALIQDKPPAPDAEDLEDTDSDMIGREGNLLLLETSLLLDSCVVGIGGAPGLGKSTFAESSGSWWQSTKLVDRIIKIDLSTPRAESLAAVLNRELDLDLTLDAPKGKAAKKKSNTTAKIKTALQNAQRKRGHEKLLILFDGVEASGSQGISDADLELLKRFLLAFHKAQAASLKEVDHDDSAGVYQNFVLVAARQLRQLALLVGDDKVHNLQPLNRDHALALTTHFLEKAGKVPDARDWETLVLTEHFGKLAQGNPLAMRLMLAAFCASAQPLSIPDFLEHFFSGGSISITSSSPGLAAHGAVSDARRLLWPEDGQPSTTATALSPFLAPFLPDTLTAYLRMIGPGRSGPATTIQALIQPLTDQGFMVHGKARNEQEESNAEYLTPHPLIPLLLRDPETTAKRGGATALKTAKTLLPQLFTARIENWPSGKMYWDKAWDGPREAVRWEFYNFLCAINMAAAQELTESSFLQLNPLAYATGKGMHSYAAVAQKAAQSGLLQLTPLVDATGKGMYWDRTRRPLMVLFWKAAVARLDGVRPALRRRGGQMALALAMSAEMMEITYLMAVTTYYADWNEARTQEWLDKTMRVFRGRTKLGEFDMIGMAYGGLLRMMQSSRVVGPSEAFSPAQMRETMAARRQAYAPLAAMGVNIGGFDDEGAFGDVGGGSLVGRGSSLQGPDSDIHGAILLAKRKMERGEPEGPDVLGARAVLYKALEGDVFLGANPPTRASVHRALSEDVEEKAARYYEQRLREKKEEAEMGEVDENETTDKLDIDETDVDNTAERGWKAVIQGHWRQALYHCEQALQIEEEAEFAKPAGRAQEERSMADFLEKKAAGVPVLEKDDPRAKPKVNRTRAEP
ncbi:CHAT domain-containing protein, partial [Staphylotrichum tortipilum]